jgi:hypothetical protein
MFTLCNKPRDPHKYNLFYHVLLFTHQNAQLKLLDVTVTILKVP